MNDLKIVFMGTPQFAVTILNGMIEQGANVCAVITSPDKPAGRGRKISESAVKKYAVEKKLTVLQPTNLKNEDFHRELKALEANLFVVVAFRMLPEAVWGMPELGTINLHASVLPQYRGAAPINWAIINGETETGVTTFFIEREIDTGKIIHSKKVAISENMTAGALHDELALLGVDAINETLKQIEEKTVVPVDQDDIELENIKNAPKIFKPDCKIDWSKSSQEIHNFIRGLSPYPGAWCNVIFKDKELTCKIFNSKTTELVSKSSDIIEVNETEFLFPCNDFKIAISEIQLEGKRRMLFKDFIAGNNIEDLKLALYM